MLEDGILLSSAGVDRFARPADGNKMAMKRHE